jgi:hypothetical protein
MAMPLGVKDESSHPPLPVLIARASFFRPLNMQLDNSLRYLKQNSQHYRHEKISLLS